MNEIAAKLGKTGNYRASTPSELRRIGVPHRVAGSKWYRSSNVPCVYPSNARPDWRAEARARKAAFDRELAKPAALPYVGDGRNLRNLLAERSEWAPKRNTLSGDDLRIALIEARYADFLETRKLEGAEMSTMIEVARSPATYTLKANAKRAAEKALKAKPGVAPSDTYTLEAVEGGFQIVWTMPAPEPVAAPPADPVEDGTLAEIPDTAVLRRKRRDELKAVERGLKRAVKRETKPEPVKTPTAFGPVKPGPVKCRVCGQMGHSDDMIRYGLRHWAHPTCFAEQHGADALASLHRMAQEARP